MAADSVEVEVVKQRQGAVSVLALEPDERRRRFAEYRVAGVSLKNLATLKGEGGGFPALAALATCIDTSNRRARLRGTIQRSIPGLAAAAAFLYPGVGESAGTHSAHKFAEPLAVALPPAVMSRSTLARQTAPKADGSARHSRGFMAAGLEVDWRLVAPPWRCDAQDLACPGVARAIRRRRRRAAARATGSIGSVALAAILPLPPRKQPADPADLLEALYASAVALDSAGALGSGSGVAEALAGRVGTAGPGRAPAPARAERPFEPFVEGVHSVADLAAWTMMPAGATDAVLYKHPELAGALQAARVVGPTSREFEAEIEGVKKARAEARARARAQDAAARAAAHAAHLVHVTRTMLPAAARRLEKSGIWRARSASQFKAAVLEALGASDGAKVFAQIARAAAQARARWRARVGNACEHVGLLRAIHRNEDWEGVNARRHLEALVDILEPSPYMKGVRAALAGKPPPQLKMAMPGDWVTCALCKYPAVCPHTLTRLAIRARTMTETEAAAYMEPYVRSGVCGVCGEMLVLETRFAEGDPERMYTNTADEAATAARRALQEAAPQVRSSAGEISARALVDAGTPIVANLYARDAAAIMRNRTATPDEKERASRVALGVYTYAYLASVVVGAPTLRIEGMRALPPNASPKARLATVMSGALRLFASRYLRYATEAGGLGGKASAEAIRRQFTGAYSAIGVIRVPLPVVTAPAQFAARLAATPAYHILEQARRAAEGIKVAGVEQVLGAPVVDFMTVRNRKRALVAFVDKVPAPLLPAGEIPKGPVSPLLYAWIAATRIAKVGELYPLEDVEREPAPHHIVTPLAPRAPLRDAEPIANLSMDPPDGVKTPWTRHIPDENMPQAGSVGFAMVFDPSTGARLRFRASAEGGRVVMKAAGRTLETFRELAQDPAANARAREAFISRSQLPGFFSMLRMRCPASAEAEPHDYGADSKCKRCGVPSAAVDRGPFAPKWDPFEYIEKYKAAVPSFRRAPTTAPTTAPTPAPAPAPAPLSSVALEWTPDTSALEAWAKASKVGVRELGELGGADDRLAANTIIGQIRLLAREWYRLRTFGTAVEPSEFVGAALASVLDAAGARAMPSDLPAGGAKDLAKLEALMLGEEFGARVAASRRLPPEDQRRWAMQALAEHVQTLRGSAKSELQKKAADAVLAAFTRQFRALSGVLAEAKETPPAKEKLKKLALETDAIDVSAFDAEGTKANDVGDVLPDDGESQDWEAGYDCECLDDNEPDLSDGE